MKPYDYNFTNDLGIFDYRKASRIFGPFARFKGGGGSSSPPSSQMPDTKTMQKIRKGLYPMIEQGMAGEGFGTPGFAALRKTSLYGGLAESFTQAKGELTSQTARTVKSGDTRVKGYLESELGRSYISQKDTLRRGLRQENVSDKQTAMDMAATTLGQEERMSVNAAQAYNQAMQSNMAMQQQYGTFGTNLAGGLGTGLMDYYFAQGMAS